MLRLVGGVRGYSTTRLRPYQEECIQVTLNNLQRGIRKQAVSLPVGSGKTVVFASLISRLPQPSPKAKKTLVLAHRQELLDQAAAKIVAADRRLSVDVDQGPRVAAVASSDVVVASVPTLGRETSSRLSRYNPNEFKCIIIDEAHHAPAASYMRILDYFDVHSPSSQILLWGCSATLRRHDGVGLGSIFDEVVFHYSLLEMIRQKWLAPIKLYSIKTKTDLSELPSYNGDFAVSSLGPIINTQSRNDILVSQWVDLVAGGAVDANKRLPSTLVFAVDVAHIYDLVDAFQAAGIEARPVHGGTPHAERVDAVADFQAGKFPVLVNCGVFTEGTDIPRIECVVLGRPTRSAVLLQQMIGRGLRTHDGKSECIVLDLVDNVTGRRSLATTPTLFGLHPEFDMNGENVVDVMDEVSELLSEYTDDVSAATSLAEAKSWVSTVKERGCTFEDAVSGHIPLNLHETSYFAWTKAPHGYMLNLRHNGKIFVRESPDGKEVSATRVYRYIPNKPFLKSEDLPITGDSAETVIRGVDTLVRSQFASSVPLVLRNARWKNDKATVAQMNLLRKLGAPLPTATASTTVTMPGGNRSPDAAVAPPPDPPLTKGQAADLINQALKARKKVSLSFK